MRLANSLISKRYFFFKTKQMLPYVIIMTLVGVAATFVMNLTIETNSYRDINYVISDYQLFFPGWVFMYAYPILMALSLFSFMHKKNASDLFAAAPVTKREYYMTNMLIALVYSAAMILIMMLVSILTVNLLDSTGVPQTVAFDAFIKIFLFLLLGFMQVYTITATAATLTGTIPAQLFTAAVMLLAPTAIIMVFQFPNLMYVDTTFSTTVDLGETYLSLSGNDVSSIIYPLNIGTSPLSLIAVLFNSNVSDAYGLMTHFTDAPAMLYTLALIIVYAIIGVEVFSRYKMENVERPFINEKFGLVIRAVIFIPIVTFCVEIFHSDGSVFNEVFITIFVVITVAYIVADLILRKGIKGLSRSLATYGIICIASLIFGISLGHVIDQYSIAKPTLINKDDISKITVYMEPLNVTPYSDENIKKYYIPVEITDEALIQKIVGDPNEEYNRGGSRWIEVTTNGKKYFARKTIGEVSLDSVYNYIDSNPNIKKSLMVYTGMSKHVKSDVLLAYTSSSVNSNKEYLTTLSKRSDIKDIRTEYEKKLLETPCKDIYASKLDQSFIQNYWLVSDGDKFGDNDAKMMMAEIKYANGMYYLSASELAYGTDEFESVIHSFDDETMYYSVKQDYSTFYPVGTINLSDERILNLETILIDMPKALKKEFRELVINTLDEDIIYDNSVIFSVGYRGKGGYFILNYERDIEPILEKYADYICGIIANKAVSTAYSCYQYGETALTNLGPSNQEAGLAELRGNLPKIKELFLTKYSEENIPMELFRGSVNYWVTYGDEYDGKKQLESVSFILDSSFETMLDIYFNEKANCEEIVEIRFYHHEFNKEVTFKKDDSEAYKILLQAVLFDRLEYYSDTGLYEEKYGTVNMNPNSASYDIYDVYTYEEPKISYYNYEQYFDAYITYSDGREENISLRLNQKAYDKFMQLSFAQ